MGESAQVEVYRFDPSLDRVPRFETYEVPHEQWHGVKVIDTIRYIYESLAPGLSFREPCRQQVCGDCVVLVNRKPVLACAVFSEKRMTIEPLPGRKVLKDLIVEFGEDTNRSGAVNGDGCEACGVCVENCPVGILRVENGKVKITDPPSCTRCRICREVCPGRAFDDLQGRR